jgi:hypothetical protein
MTEHHASTPPEQAASQSESDLPQGLLLSLTLSRDDLAHLGLHEEETAVLSEADLALIAQRMVDHYRHDAFWDELEYNIQRLLEEKAAE